MDPKFGLLAVAAVVTFVVLVCIFVKPALPDTNVRETTGVSLTAAADEQQLAANTLPKDIASGIYDFVSNRLQAAIDSEQARYSAVYTAQIVIGDFWNKQAPRYVGLTAQRFTPATPQTRPPGSAPGTTPNEIASTFTIALERTGGPTSSKFLVRPKVARINKAMAKMLRGRWFAPGSLLTDTTTLLNVEIKWKVEDLTGTSDKATEAVVELAGYDMTARDDIGHVNYFNGDKSSAVGVLDFPHSGEDSGLYRVTVTVTEKDPLNAGRSVDADKTLLKNLIDALKKLE